jgi:hypothetical protein
MMTRAAVGLAVPLFLVALSVPTVAETTRFADPHPDGNVIEYWRLTHDPAIRDHANYHNTQCWSPDGRYVCYSHYDTEPGARSEGGVHVVDLHTGEDIFVGAGHKGGAPRWAQQHSWLFYAVRNEEGGDPWEKGIEVWRYDCATGERDLITWGWEFLGSTDHQDRWIFGNQRRRDLEGKVFHTGRALIAPSSEMEVIFAEPGIRPLCNPAHDVISIRAKREGMFESSRLWMDYDGSNLRIGVPNVQEGHMCWSGDGEWQLVGNYQARGRHWDEPFPSDMHLLANIGFGDISPCGRSGRWICGDYALADLRSGDGTGLPRPPSVLCYPKTISDNSGPYDADPKGSPDGTKICFVSNYPFDRAPFTRIGETVTDEDSLPVESTDGFPDAGEINVLGEVVGYASKTATTFEGLERHKYGTGKYGFLKKNWYATLFADRLLTDEERGRALPPSSWMIDAVTEVGGDPETSPLLYQRQTDVYCSVIRLPDPPHLRLAGGAVELIPGENHWETYGYHLERDGERIAGNPVRPGDGYTLDAAGTYRAVAVEWSGLEGRPSLPLQVEGGARLTVLAEKPADFSWTEHACLVDGHETTEEQAKAADEAVCEVRHLHDGVVRRERFAAGAMVSAYDLNADGYATRRLMYEDGKLMTREYWRPDVDQRVSLETFGADGFKLEDTRWDLRYDPPTETDHWWYDHGTPVKRSIKNGRDVYEKRGDEWVKVEPPQ